MEILIGREHIDPRLLMRTDPSLAKIMSNLNFCTSIAGMLDGENVAAILLSETGETFTVENFSVKEGFSYETEGKELLLYTMDYAREKKARYLVAGAGNAMLQQHAMLQKMGYRVTGVAPDYYKAEGKPMVVENSIVNRDQLLYRVDFEDGWTTWTPEVKYK